MLKHLPVVLRRIFAVRINSREQIEVTIREAMGRQWVDVRIWTRDLDGEMVSTPKGLSLKSENLRDVIKALQEAADDELIGAPAPTENGGVA